MAKTQVPCQLDDDELKALDDWAVAQKHTMTSGRANRGQALRALVRTLLSDEPVSLGRHDVLSWAEQALCELLGSHARVEGDSKRVKADIPGTDKRWLRIEVLRQGRRKGIEIAIKVPEGRAPSLRRSFEQLSPPGAALPVDRASGGYSYFGLHVDAEELEFFDRQQEVEAALQAVYAWQEGVP